MPLIPLLVVLAGLAYYLSRRRNDHDAIEDSPRVVVKGHTYSESIEMKKPRRVFEIRNACFVGSGYVGALTAIVLASKNPHIHFHVVDFDPHRIAAWNSDCLPILEPGVDELLNSINAEMSSVPLDETESEASEYQLVQRKRLPNISFSADVEGCIARADLVFLCVDNDTLRQSDGEDGLNMVHLESAVRTIARISTGHKIVVQKSTAPCGIVHWIGKELKSSSCTFDVLSNPEFITPGTAIRDLLYPHRVVIGHIVSEGMASAEAVNALKRLYTPWIPDERIVTTDAWSSELSKIAVNALIAQRISSLRSVKTICEKANANMEDIAQITGFDWAGGAPQMDESHSRSDVLCLIYLARELGLNDVAEYWRAVSRVNLQSRIALPSVPDAEPTQPLLDAKPEMEMVECV
ncbi:hypothetical protein MW887_005686 [Aspergillus wentii]|nr:hypothetical protein MW887_005686 [Aspergillus wentii]